MSNNNNNNNNNDDGSGSLYSLYKLCLALEGESSHTGKSQIVAQFVDQFKGDLYTLSKLTLVKEDKRVYRIKDKQMVKILAEIWDADYDEMISDLDHGDVTETAKKFYIKYGKYPEKSTLTLKQVDEFLDKLTTVSKFDDQVNVISKFVKKCTPNDWRLVARIIDSDLKINLGAKYFLEALHPQAHEAYKAANNLKSVIDAIKNHGFDKKAGPVGAMKMKSLDVGLQLMTPVKPMLPKANKSVDEVMRTAGDEFFAEIKYDGERIQIHKNGNTYACYSRNLKPIQPWKVEEVKPYIPKATKADSIILDGEILLMDTATSKPLPFGTLGVHKKKGFQDATVCVFLFDILYLNGKSLLNMPIKQRRELLEKNITVVKHRVELSEITVLNAKTDKHKLNALLNRTFQEKLEGLVVKDSASIYEPGMRHWIKVKKDYLAGMADTADLLALGGYYGTGTSGGLVTVFLMCVYDTEDKNYKTVCKVSGGLDDSAIAKLQPIVKKTMTKISKDSTKLPPWLDIIKSYTPDFIINDPKQAMVFEIETAELTGTKHHTSGFSMRFPRIIKIRKDKDWSTSTTMSELRDLGKDVKIMTYDSDDERDDDNKLVPHHKKIKNNVDATTKTSSPPVKSPTTTTTTTSNQNSKVSFVLGDLTEPFETDSTSNSIFILNYTDNAGVWRTSGISGVIGKKWSNVKKEYTQLSLGDMSVVKVEKNGNKKLFVCNICCIAAPSTKQPNYEFSLYKFKECLAKVQIAAQMKGASVHTIKPNYPNIDWEGVEEIFVDLLVEKGTKLFIHSISKKDTQKPKAMTTTGSPVTTTTTTTSSPKTNNTDKDSNNNKNGNSKKRNMDYLTEDEMRIEVGNVKPVFSGVRAMISGYAKSEVTRLEKLITSLGGEIITTWKSFGVDKSTHLICETSNDDFKHVERLGGLVVKSAWVDSCFNDGVLVEEDQYVFEDLSSSSTTTTTTTSTTVTSPKQSNQQKLLCEIFSGLTFDICKDVNDKEILRRYIIAFNGGVIGSGGNTSGKPTHIITSNTDKAALMALKKDNPKSEIVKPLWVWDSINGKQKLDIKAY